MSFATSWRYIVCRLKICCRRLLRMHLCCIIELQPTSRLFPAHPRRCPGHPVWLPHRTGPAPRRRALGSLLPAAADCTAHLHEGRWRLQEDRWQPGQLARPAVPAARQQVGDTPAVQRHCRRAGWRHAHGCCVRDRLCRCAPAAHAPAATGELGECTRAVCLPCHEEACCISFPGHGPALLLLAVGTAGAVHHDAVCSFSTSLAG